MGMQTKYGQNVADCMGKMLANYCQVDIFLAQSWHLVVILWTYCGNGQFVDILGTLCGQFVDKMPMFS